MRPLLQSLLLPHKRWRSHQVLRVIWELIYTTNDGYLLLSHHTCFMFCSSERHRQGHRKPLDRWWLALKTSRCQTCQQAHAYQLPQPGTLWGRQLNNISKSITASGEAKSPRHCHLTCPNNLHVESLCTAFGARMRQSQWKEAKQTCWRG